MTETEFRIPVRKANMSVCRDISEASQGETALTKTALSFAVFQHALGRYDILCLDEIDSTLDSANRAGFMDILQQQVETLGLEQVFVISHNHHFHSAEVGIICFRDHSLDIGDPAFMTNKTLLANYG